jgi:3',5'-cyclic AMP phosphodiesterase CpdA
VRIVGLYSNCLENPGYLEGRDAKGKVDMSQITWVQKTLASIAKNKEKKALIVATHHPPYSQGGHSGSTEMNASIDDACTKAGVTPDLFLSGHAHNYQRYTRRIGGKQVPYIVAGTGGISPQKVDPASGQVLEGTVTYDAAHESYGYLLLGVSKTQIKIAFWVLDPPDNKPFESIVVDLATGMVS